MMKEKMKRKIQTMEEQKNMFLFLTTFFLIQGLVSYKFACMSTIIYYVYIIYIFIHFRFKKYL